MAGKSDGANSMDRIWEEILRRQAQPLRGYEQFLPKSKPLSRSERLKRKFLDRLARLPIIWDVLRGRHECD